MLTRLMIAVVLISSVGAADGVQSDLGQEPGSVAGDGQVLTRIIEGEVFASARGQADPDPPETEPVRLPTEEPTIEPTPMPPTPLPTMADIGPPLDILPANPSVVVPPNQATDTPTALPPTETTETSTTVPSEEPTATTESTNGNGNDNDGESNLPLYVGIGALLVLAVGAGVVFGTRRSNR